MQGFSRLDSLRRPGLKSWTGCEGMRASMGLEDLPAAINYVCLIQLYLRWYPLSRLLNYVISSVAILYV